MPHSNSLSPDTKSDQSRHLEHADETPHCMNAIASKSYSASNGSGTSCQGLLRSYASCATSKPIGLTCCEEVSKNIAFNACSSQWPVPVNVARGLAAPRQLHESWLLHPSPSPVAAAYTTSSSPANDAGDLLQLLLRVCASTTSTIADPRLGHRAPRFSESDSDYPSPVYQDPHGLLFRMIHADAAAAALRQANAQARARWS